MTTRCPTSGKTSSTTCRPDKPAIVRDLEAFEGRGAAITYSIVARTAGQRLAFRPFRPVISCSGRLHSGLLRDRGEGCSEIEVAVKPASRKSFSVRPHMPTRRLFGHVDRIPLSVSALAISRQSRAIHPPHDATDLSRDSAAPIGFTKNYHPAGPA